MSSFGGLNINANAVVIILLGIISCLFPMISSMTIGMISGFAFFMIAISMLLVGLSTFSMNKLIGIMNIVLAFVAIFFSLSLIFNPQLVSSFISFITYFVGLLMIVSGVFNVFMKEDMQYLDYFGYITIILGIIYILVGIFIANPIYLGIIVGLWLILSGVFDCLRPSGRI